MVSIGQPLQSHFFQFCGLYYWYLRFGCLFLVFRVFFNAIPAFCAHRYGLCSCSRFDRLFLRVFSGVFRSLRFWSEFVFLGDRTYWFFLLVCPTSLVFILILSFSFWLALFGSVPTWHRLLEFFCYCFGFSIEALSSRPSFGFFYRCCSPLNRRFLLRAQTQSNIWPIMSFALKGETWQVRVLVFVFPVTESPFSSPGGFMSIRLTLRCRHLGTGDLCAVRLCHAIDL